MPRGRTKLPETIDEVEEDLRSERSAKSTKSGKKVGTTGAADDAVADVVVAPAVEPHFDKMRAELIRLSEDGEVSQSVAYLKKASKRMIGKVHGELERRRSAKANESLTDMIISKWADVLGGLGAIESSESLTDELRKDQLLRRDILKAAEMITPFAPLLGILSGGATTVKHVYDHKSNPNKPALNSEEGPKQK